MDFETSNTTHESLSAAQELREIKRRLGLFEVIISLTFAISFTLVFALIKIMGIEIYYSALLPFLILFFSSTFLTIQFTWYLIRVGSVAGSSLKSIGNKIREDWKTEKTLNKILILLGAPSTLFTFYKIISFLVTWVQVRMF